ncbi:MAG: chitobiase/beta-hexosaminidase C-terminal domain-containing protein [Deltaproteobacteria bacterium]|nr:MAG: chitobiase/beta-hexosaminidase C-terminal domain-containing protein [Deltaproteobacteria bacterium]
MKLKSLIVISAVAWIGLLGCRDEKKISPSPESMTPSKSWNTAKTDVEITGEGFMAQIKENLDGDDKAEIITKIAASLGSYPLEKVAFHNSRKLTAVVPAGLPPGVYDLIVTNPDGEMGILTEAFEVTNISSVEPVVGCLGDPVTISGSYFGADAGTVSFNETEAEVISWTDTSIVVSAPGGDYTEVRVVPAAGHLSSIPGSYSYDDQGPVGLAASPAGGSYCPTTISLSVSEGTIYYTFGENGPMTGSRIYTGPINAQSGALMFEAVDACGNRTGIVSELYDIDEIAPTGLWAEPAGGSYCGTTMVSLGASEGTIYYTTDHTYPTTKSPAYSEPIEVTADITAIKFMAADTCGNQSYVKIENYDIDTEALVTITSPVDGETVIIPGDVVSGDVTVVGTADLDIATVTVTTDQGHYVLTDMDANGNWSVVLEGASISSLVITVRGTDNCGNTGSHSVTVTLHVPTIWYVNVTATVDGPGTSWDNPFNTVQSAADAASSGHMIWVAEGTYYGPDNTEPRLKMKDGVEVYGGFIGDEVLLSERGDPSVHQTILDGGYMSYHVVVGASNARLDGFVVKGGNAIGAYPDDRGGGMYNSGVTDLVVANCEFSVNTTVTKGGGMYNSGVSDLVVANCNFSGNSTSAYGGGMCNEGGTNLVVTDCTFSNNWAMAEVTEAYGGGMANLSSGPKITNCTFFENSAVKGGGIYNEYSSLTVNNCIFYNNYCESGFSDEGGAMYNHSSLPAINNCTFSVNYAESGGGIYNANSSSPKITNCILWDDYAVTKPEICNDGASTAIVSYSDVEGGWPGTGNIGLNPDLHNPLFVTGPMGSFYLSHWETHDVDSPCIDAGSDYAVELGMDDKTTRVDGVLDKEIVDMGYHYEPVILAL